MKNTKVFIILVFFLALFCQSGAHAAYEMKAEGNSFKGSFDAFLVDPSKNAEKKSATVEVKVSEIQLVDPTAANKESDSMQGHLHYQIDGGYVIATPSAKLSFHGLSSGNHKILVMLADSQHKPLGPKKELSVVIP